MPAPNILFIISDQHAPQVTGCHGADFVRTPNLDRFSAEGVTFDNAYCNHPHCVPSRAALMTGLQTHRIPCYDFLSPFASSLPTWAHMLRRAGYRVEMDGKMHFYGSDQLHGFHEHVNEPGHERIHGFRWGQENPNPAVGLEYWRDLHFEGDPLYESRTSNERAILSYACNFLQRSAKQSEPFCLTVGFQGPHYPQICTRQMYESYDDVEIPDPRLDRTLHPRNQHWKQVWGFDRFTPQDTAQGRQAYCAMVTHVDDWIGRILQTLERTGQAENTIVIYSSDQGYYLGEHDYIDKRWMYEESFRTPLLVRWPDMIEPGSVSTDMAMNLDFAQTFLVNFTRGRDSGGLAEERLLPLLRIPRRTQRTAALRSADRALQADPLLRRRDRRVGVVRSGEGSE